LFFISTISDIVKIPPNLLGKPLKHAVITSLKQKYESWIDDKLGLIIMILDAKVESMGRIISGVGSTNYKVQFDALTFHPNLLEIVRGIIVEVTDFGAMVRIGPLDALLHLSQILDDKLKSDVRAGTIIGNSGKSMKLGTRIRARITAVSLPQKTGGIKISLTCKQSHLGADEWFTK
jgi:DNA-directed RNA polymerase subunit E'